MVYDSMFRVFYDIVAFLGVCIYIYMYICIYIYVYVYMYVYMYICIYVYMYICIYVYMYICIYVYMYICIYVYMYICIYVYMYICIYVYMYICIYVYMYIIYVCIYVYIYMYICIYTFILGQTHIIKSIQRTLTPRGFLSNCLARWAALPYSAVQMLTIWNILNEKPGLELNNGRIMSNPTRFCLKKDKLEQPQEPGCMHGQS